MRTNDNTKYNQQGRGGEGCAGGGVIITHNHTITAESVRQGGGECVLLGGWVAHNNNTKHLPKTLNHKHRKNHTTKS